MSARKDYDQAGCASGCRDTMATGVLLGGLLAVIAVRAARSRRGGRRG